MDKFLVPINHTQSTQSILQPHTSHTARPYKRLKKLHTFPVTQSYNDTENINNNVQTNVNANDSNLYDDAYIDHLGVSVVSTNNTNTVVHHTVQDTKHNDNTTQRVQYCQSAILYNSLYLNASYCTQLRLQRKQLQQSILQSLQQFKPLPIELSSFAVTGTESYYREAQIIDNIHTQQQQLVLMNNHGTIQIHDISLLYSILNSTDCVINQSIETTDNTETDPIKRYVVRTPAAIHSFTTSQRSALLLKHNPNASMSCILTVGERNQRINVYSTIDYTLNTTFEYNDTSTSIPDYITDCWQLNDNSVYLQLRSHKLVRYTSNNTQMLLAPKLVTQAKQAPIAGIYDSTLQSHQAVIIYRNGTIQYLNTKLSPVTVQSTVSLWTTFTCTNTERTVDTALELCQLQQHPYLSHIFTFQFNHSEQTIGLLDLYNKTFCYYYMAIKRSVTQVLWHPVPHVNVLIVMISHFTAEELLFTHQLYAFPCNLHQLSIHVNLVPVTQLPIEYGLIRATRIAMCTQYPNMLLVTTDCQVHVLMPYDS